MREKMKRFGESGKEKLSRTNRKLKLLTTAAACALLIGVGGSVFWSQNHYVLLFQDLSEDDMASIQEYLQEQDIADYRVDGGDTIFVRKNQRALLKAKVLAAGYPSDYILYEDNGTAPEISEDRDTFLRLDLQERLANVIKGYDNVREASVFIVPGEGEETDSAASIVVTTVSGRLTEETAAGIRRTVNQAVDHLPAENVMIEDQDGNLYIDTEQH